jgi:hypothetical protein
VSVVCVLFTHLGAPETAAGVAHLRACDPDVRVVVCHGGPREAFDAVAEPAKLWIDEPGLRGAPAELQTYTSALVQLHERFVARDPDVDAVCLLEFDHVPLQRGFVTRLAGLLDETGADFLGKTAGDKTGTNWWHRVRYRDDPRLLAHLASVSVREDPARLYGCLGTGFVMRRTALEAFAAAPHLDGIYVELYLPTMVHHLGFRVEDVDRVADVYSHVRWTPPYDLDEVLELRTQGIPVVHPFKAIDQLERLRPA